jgi:hypothetical protein
MENKPINSKGRNATALDIFAEAVFDDVHFDSCINCKAGLMASLDSPVDVVISPIIMRAKEQIHEENHKAY